MIEIVWSNIWVSLEVHKFEKQEEQGVIDQLYAQMMGWA